MITYDYPGTVASAWPEMIMRLDWYALKSLNIYSSDMSWQAVIDIAESKRDKYSMYS